MDFGALPPEINSARMYAGPGSGPMLAAAAAWDALAAELHYTAVGYGSVIADLTSGPWVGPAATAMTAAVAPFVGWLGATAMQAEQTATQAKAAVAAYEAAFAMTVPPPVIAANRSLLMTLIATNFFGQNTPAIAATEAQYAEMWAQDATAMYGYAGSSAAASNVTPFTPPKTTTDPAGVAAQSAAVAKATATPAANSAQTATSATPQLVSASSVHQALQHLASTPATTTTGSQTSSTLPSWLQPLGDLTTANRNTLRQALQAYFPLGMAQFFSSIAQQMIPGSAGGAGAAGSAPMPGAGLPALGSLGGFGGGAPVSAGVGSASSLGQLSVPPSWATGAPGFSQAAAASQLSLGGASGNGSGLLRGMPLASAGRRGGGGFTHRYGFRYSVMTRPPSAG